MVVIRQNVVNTMGWDVVYLRLSNNNNNNNNNINNNYNNNINNYTYKFIQSGP